MHILCTRQTPNNHLMVLHRLHLGLTAAQLRKLDKLAAKLNLDRTNTLRYCLARTAEIENIK